MNTIKAHCKLILEQKGSAKKKIKKKKIETEREKTKQKTCKMQKQNVGCVIRRSQYLYHKLPNI